MAKKKATAAKKKAAPKKKAAKPRVSPALDPSSAPPQASDEDFAVRVIAKQAGVSESTARKMLAKLDVAALVAAARSGEIETVRGMVRGKS